MNRFAKHSNSIEEINKIIPQAKRKLSFNGCPIQHEDMTNISQILGVDNAIHDESMLNKDESFFIPMEEYTKLVQQRKEIYNEYQDVLEDRLIEISK